MQLFYGTNDSFNNNVALLHVFRIIIDVHMCVDNLTFYVQLYRKLTEA
jgi:hypothetical protein